MADPNPDPIEAVDLCAADALVERGRAHVWDVLLADGPATAFALRVDGAPVAFINRCAHVAAEMDWNPGEFLDASRNYIVCSIHGAEYEADSGRCAGGPCGRASLHKLDVREAAGTVRWYPSSAVKPLRFDDDATVKVADA